MFRLNHVLRAGLLAALLTGCQPVSPTPPTDVDQAPQAVAEETDLGCAFYYFLSGRYAELSLSFDEALEAYQKALICDTEASHIAVKIPILLMRLDRESEAISWLQNTLVQDPANVELRMLLARILVQQKRYQEASEQYLIVQRLQPEEATPLLLLSEIYQTRGMQQEAEATLHQVLDMDPNNFSAIVLLARMYRQDRVDEALKLYQQAKQLSWSPALVMETAELLEQEKRFDEAAALYREVLDGDGVNEDARIALVHVLLQQGKEEAALAELNRLKELTEEPERVDMTIARLYARKKQFNKAASILEQLLEQEELSQARYLLAILYFQMGESTATLEQLQRIDRTASEYEEALFMQARVLRTLDRSEEAIALLEEAVTDDETRTPEMFVMLASIYQLQGKSTEGDETFNRGLNLFPTDDNLLYEYGLFLEQSGRREKAMTVMQQVIELEPDHAGALNFVGYTWADEQVHLDQALAYIERAVQLQPENGYIRDSLGWVHYRLGHLELALKNLLAAIDLSPDDFAIFDHLGDVYLSMGEVDKAREAYETALKMAEEEEDQRSMRKKLEILQQQEGP